MKTPLLISLLTFIPLTLSAQTPTPPGPVGNSLRLELRNPTNTGFSSYWLTFPGFNSSLVWDNSVNLPRMAALDPVFSYAGGAPNAPLSIDFTGLNLSDYGLGDVVLNADLATAMATKMDLPSGTVSEYIRGDGSIVALPSIPASQVNSDWEAVSGVAQILNKPSLSPVATSGAYGDLSGLPALGTAAATNSTAYATAAQGTLASTALQSGTAQSNISGLVTDLSGKFPTPTGTTLQYLRGDGSLALFPVNLSSFVNNTNFITAAGVNFSTVIAALGFTPYNATNPAGYITASGATITLTTTGTSGVATWNTGTRTLNIPNYTPTALNFSAPVASISISSGVAFQPRSTGPCQILVNTNVSGLLNVGTSITVAMSPTSGGTYATVATDAASIVLLGLGDKASGLIPVPTGYWVRVTYTPVGLATVSGNYTRWDIS